MLVCEGRQHDCNDDSQVRSAPSDFSSAPTCLAARMYVSQCTFLYDHRRPAGTQLILGVVKFCMLHMLQVCLLKNDSAYAAMWPSTASNYIQRYTALLCQTTCHLSSVCHVHWLRKIPVCGKQYIDTCTKQTKSIKHNCAAANTVTRALFCVQKPNSLYTD